MTVTNRINTPCNEWQGARNEYGYGIKRINGKPTRIHRWVWSQHNGPIPSGMEVMHLCDNPPCYRHDHLTIGTHADNMRDMVNKGRQARHNKPTGARNARTKLTWDQVDRIRDRLANGETMRALAREYDVAPPTIQKLRDRATWRGESR